ncbi:MAG: hypothetical protein JXB05_34460 [Myxococcaceae bacterium]|nr:hypothetical protein [Myxococcaceae bacterium]
MNDSSAHPCKRHPSAPAGWSCQDCQASLCQDCVCVKRAQSAEYLTCALCGGVAARLMLHRARIPLARRLRSVWRFPFTSTGLPFVLALSTFLALAWWGAQATFLLLKFLPAMMYLGAFWAAFFAIVRASAAGARDLEAPDFHDLSTHVIAPALRGLAATAVLWLPLLLYWIYRHDLLESLAPVTEDPRFYVDGTADAATAPRNPLGDPVLWLILAAGFAYVPMVLILAASGSGMFRMLNPLYVIGGALRLGKDYGVAVGALGVLLIPYVLSKLLASWVLSLNLFLLSRVVAELLITLVPVMMAHVLGLLLYVRGDVVGYGMASDYLEPALPGAQPRAQPAPLHQPLPRATAEPPPDDTPTIDGVAALATAVAAQDATQALSLYPSLRDPRLSKQVAPEHHLFVGQSAATLGRYALAVQALEAAADVAPDGPIAPRALVLMARLYAERLQEPARADSIYRYVVHRYPNTDASRFAQAHLPPTG